MTALFVIALLCSEHAASFPLALGALAVLGQGRRDARRLMRELAPVWTVGAAYLGAKLLFLYVLWPRWDPLRAALFHNAYALDFDPATAVATLGATSAPRWLRSIALRRPLRGAAPPVRSASCSPWG